MQTAAFVICVRRCHYLEQEQKTIFSIQAVLEDLSNTTLISMKTVLLPLADTEMSISDTELIY